MQFGILVIGLCVLCSEVFGIEPHSGENFRPLRLRDFDPGPTCRGRPPILRHLFPNLPTQDPPTPDTAIHRSKRSADASRDYVASLLSAWRCTEPGSVKQKCCSRCTCSSSGFWQCDYRGRCNPDLCNYDQIVREDAEMRNQFLQQTDDVRRQDNDVTNSETEEIEQDDVKAAVEESHRLKRSVRSTGDVSRLSGRDIFRRQCVPGAWKLAPDCCNTCECTARGYWRCTRMYRCANPGCFDWRNRVKNRRQKRAAGAKSPDIYTRGRWPSFLTGRRVPQTAKQVCVSNADMGRSFFDGCNNCRCYGIGRAGCTRKRCF